MNIILQGKIEEAIKKMSHNKTSFWEDYDYSIKDIEEIIYDACKKHQSYINTYEEAVEAALLYTLKNLI